MSFAWYLKHIWTDPKWFFRYGLWQMLGFRMLWRLIFKYPYQRLTRGFDDRDTWSLDHTFALWALPRLKRFKEVNDGIPLQFIDNPGMENEIVREKEWEDTIQKMITACELTIKEEHHYVILTDAEYAQIQEGFELFGKYLRELWW